LKKSKNTNLVFCFAGQLNHSALSARLLALSQVINYPTYFISLFRSGLNANPDVVSVKYLSNDSSYLVIRIAQRILGNLRGIVYCMFLSKSIIYFYNPRVIAGFLPMLFARIRGHLVIMDRTEIYHHRHKWLGDKISDSLTFRLAHVNFCISNYILNKAKERTTEVNELPIVVDFNRFFSKITPQQNLIGYVGTSGPKDGLELVLAGFAKALESNTKLRLRIIGPKPCYFDYDALVKELNLVDHIELTGSITHDEVPEKLLQCDTFIMNRTNSEFAKYGYPTKLGEYFACKRPVLMSNGPGFSEDYTDKVEAIKYEVDNPQALADAILWRYNNPKEAEAIAQCGYDYAKKHFAAEVVGAIFRDTIQTYLEDRA
jgi:glycosyltransferase involved in cell wall biosynthesis